MKAETHALPAEPEVASWLTIDGGALRHNLSVLRGMVGGAVGVGCVLKANAYGHGLMPCLVALHDVVDAIYVVTAQDALAVRAWETAQDAARRDVLVIGPVSVEEAACLSRARVDLVMADLQFGALARALAARRLPALRIHVHIDSGLGREGLVADDLSPALAFLDEVGDAVSVAGVLTHFADVEDVTEQAYALSQLQRFAEAETRLVALLQAKGRPTALTRHAAASAAAMVLPSSRFDVVRPGIATYGFWPSRETRIGARLMRGDLPELRPALSWRCPSQLVKTLPAGSYVGYGCSHRCRDTTRVAVLPVGYFDGYPRLLSNRAHVLVHGRRCPVLGRVMMNHVIVDVTGVPGVQDGDRVVATLIGAEGDERITAEDLAGWSQTIHYEIVARLGAHLRRELVGL